MATKAREEIKRTTKQKMARRHNKEGGNRKATDRRQWKTLMEGYILQWMNKAQGKGKGETEPGSKKPESLCGYISVPSTGTNTTTQLVNP